MLWIEPGDIGSVIRESLDPNFLDGAIVESIERRVTRMVRFFVGIVAARVVATDHRPTRMLGAVLVTAMQQVRVEKQHVSRIHLDVQMVVAFQNLGDPFGIGARLVTRSADGEFDRSGVSHG